jgi:uracil-DNA glycosylase
MYNFFIFNNGFFMQPLPDCGLCPRLANFRAENQARYRTYQNRPVPSFGSLEASRLIVGLAPGLHGANQTGRPFTGDYAGDILYKALLKVGLVQGEYSRVATDGLQLCDVRITNAVRCVPPENKPTTQEIQTCNHFLREEIAAMPDLRVILSLGSISHKSVLKALGLRQSAFPFGHGVTYALAPTLTLLSSYHTSRYNINTGVLTQAMFDAVIKRFAEGK